MSDVGDDRAFELTGIFAAGHFGHLLPSTILVTVMGIMIAINAVVAHEVGACFRQIPSHCGNQCGWFLCRANVCGLRMLRPLFSIIIYSSNHNRQCQRSQFVHVISLGMPAFAMYRVCRSYHLRHETKPVMVAIIGLLFNIVVNWLFIGQFDCPTFILPVAMATGVGMVDVGLHALVDP